MVKIEKDRLVFEGSSGTLEVPDEEAMRKFAMLLEGQCGPLGPTAAAAKFGFSKQRYFQLLHAVRARGVEALRNRKRGPKTRRRRTPDVVQEIIRHRFLDPDASPEVIAQKLRQSGRPVSTRSVERTITEWGLQKKTPRRTPAAGLDRNAAHQARCPPRSLR